jgi:cis-3-alkyl-4-acyloxetan-2-one decarboxylase
MISSYLCHLYPFKSRFLDIDGVRMHYVDEGEGPAIVLVHGNPTWSFYFRDLIKGLRDRYRVIAMDHIGCGLSDKPQKYAYTLGTHIKNFKRLMDHLQFDRVTLGVHDWGGPIGFGWTTRNPDRVERLIVFNTAAFLGGKMPLRIKMCGWPIVGDILVRGLNGFCRAATHMASRHRSRVTPEVVAGYLAPYDSWANRVAILRFVQDIPFSPNVPSFAVFGEIESKLEVLRDKPMNIFWGMQDFCFTSAFLDQWVHHFPDARVHRFEDAGHYVVEDAHERILTILRDELEKAPEKRETESSARETADRLAASL